MSLGFARLSGQSAATVHGTNLLGTAPKGKSYGLLALGTRLYAWISPGSNARNYDEARLYSAPLGTNTWTAAKWAFTKNDPARIILPTFLQAGKNYVLGGDFVYVYAPRYAPTVAGQLSIQATPGGSGEIALLRADRKKDLLAKASWEFYAGLDQSGTPKWSPDKASSTAPARDHGQERRRLDGERRLRPRAEALSGRDRAWHLVRRPAHPGRVGASRGALEHGGLPDGRGPAGADRDHGSHYDFLPNAFSTDGKRFTLVFAGTGNADALNLVDGSFTAAGGGGAGAATATVVAARERQRR